MEHKGKETILIFEEQRIKVKNYIEQLHEENQKLHIQLLKNHIMQNILKTQLDNTVSSLLSIGTSVQIDVDRISIDESDLKEINEFLEGTDWELKWKVNYGCILVKKNS